MKNRTCILILILAISVNLAGYGQTIPDTTTTYRIETKDGNIFTGSVIARDQEIIVIKTKIYGALRIPVSEVRSETELKEVVMVKDKIWLPNPQSGRYFWAPNGYGLEKGKSYYQNIWVLYNQVSIGVADNFSIGGGMVPLFLFQTSTPVWIVPKVSIPVVRDKVNLGTGAFLGTILGEDTGLFGLLYETTTIGTRDKNASLGIAYGFYSDEWMHKPIINFSAMFRVSPRGYFISENYIIPYETDSGTYGGDPVSKSAIVVSLGGRSIIRNIGLDYSLWIPLNMDTEGFVAAPFLGVTVPIGKIK